MINFPHFTPERALVAYNELGKSYNNCINNYLKSTNENDKEYWKKQAEDGLVILKKLENDLHQFSMPFNSIYRVHHF